MNQKSRAILASLAILSLLSGCASTVSAPPKWPEVNVEGAEEELPVGAELLQRSALQELVDGTVSSTPPWGSIRPDARPVEQRIPDIIERGRIVVGVGQYLNRLGFRDPLSGELEGFEIDLAKEIAQDIFGDPSKVEFRYVENRRREEALKTGDVDMVVRTWTITQPRQNTTEFSVPYLGISSKLMVMRDSGITEKADLKNKTICATRDSAPTRTIDGIDIGGLLITRTWTDCLLAMQRNQADAIFSDDAILSGLQAQDPSTTVIDTGESTSYYGVGMPAPTTGRRAEGLVMQVNSTIERIKADGTWDRLYEEWMQEYLGDPKSLPLKYRSEQENQEIYESRVQWLRNNTESPVSRVAGTINREDFHD
ncbi:transporter substrate-binding domain-containing protein [uncultured Corynebacterium sp.]|uniref:transporter substrate-binding domain-containing protein n=1 Tax=uncultured Corynebacterium sp. TaxID=159447 RepID=UPI00259A1862|nr:transporter substrate-binding domain-containing protein [uncultured Corynebacterium sp.]